MTLTLDYTDGIDDIATVEPPAAGTHHAADPDRARHPGPAAAAVRGQAGLLRHRPPPTGPYSDYIVRKEAATEDRAVQRLGRVQLQRLYFQPGSKSRSCSASSSACAQNGLTLSGPPGQRTVFGASGALRHTVTADGGSITFANQAELLGHWIVAITLQVERDWTWGRLRPAAGSRPRPAPGADVGRPVAQLQPRRRPDRRDHRAADDRGQHARRPWRGGGPLGHADHLLRRDRPDPAPGAFPARSSPDYTVTAAFEAAAAQTLRCRSRCRSPRRPRRRRRSSRPGWPNRPTRRPAIIPRPSPRDRFLWIEFDQPIADPTTATSAACWPTARTRCWPRARADPRSGSDAAESPEPALPIDPEPVRVIFPGQASDESGLSAMTQLIPAVADSGGTQGTFFMLPLPPGVTAEDAQLFGFWTYEFRVGHAKRWSTAQGRFGRPVRVTGIQHPPPTLICSVNRTEQGIRSALPTRPPCSTAVACSSPRTIRRPRSGSCSTPRRCRRTAPPSATSCSATRAGTRSAGHGRPARSASLPRVPAEGGDRVAEPARPGADQLAERARGRAPAVRPGAIPDGRQPGPGAGGKRPTAHPTLPCSAPIRSARTSAAGGSCGPRP